MKRMLALALALAVGGAACNNGSTASSTTTPSAVLVSETLTGSVPAAANGVLQAASVPFTVASPGGAVTITLTAAVQTNPDGTTNPAVVMGISVGTPSGTTCPLVAGAVPYLMQASASSTLSGNVSAGAYCVQVSDVTNQGGPVAFTLVISHP